MKQPRTAVVVASLNHKIYGIGGECVKTPRETHYLKSVELMIQCTTLGPMLLICSNHVLPASSARPSENPG